MKKLEDNWLTQGLIDFEYKKYVLLAYLQVAKEEFAGKKLYPVFSDLIFHYKNLLTIRENKNLYYESFPKRISKADFEKLTLTYQKIVEDDDMMKAITEIVLFAIPKFEGILANGKELYELVEKNVSIIPVGISPISYQEGYMMVNEFRVKELQIFHYQITIFENAEEKFRGISTRFVERVRKGLGDTYENIKIGLVRRYQTLPNPATFLVDSQIDCPFEETLMPVAKRLLVRHISQMAA